MVFELFQTVYIYFSLILVSFLTIFFQKKESCTCHIKAPSSMVAFITAFILGIINGFTTLTYILLFFLFTGIVGSILFSKVNKIAGGITYFIGFITVFVGFEFLGIKEIINTGFENISIFGALIAIIIIFLKKYDKIIISYILGILIFFLTFVLSGIPPLAVGSMLISLSEIMLIYNNDFEKEISETIYKKIAYFSAALYSFGMLLIPIALLIS